MNDGLSTALDPNSIGVLPLIDPNSGLFTRGFYGNTLIDWLQAFAIIVGALILGRILYWLIGKTIKRLAAKTRTRLDDILVDMLEEPFVFAIIILGIWYGIHTLKLTDTAKDVVNKAHIVLIIVNVAWLISRVLDALIKAYLVPFARATESDLDDHLVSIIRKSLKFVVWTMAVIVTMEATNLDVWSLLAGLGVGGLAFALAAQETVGNFFGSIAIFLDKPFRVGDRIQLRDYDGVVTSVGLRSTRLRTRYEGRIVAIPNSLVARAEVVNVDTENGRQMFSVYRLTPEMSDQQIETAMALLKQIAESDEDTQEKVVTGFIAITEYSRDIMLLYWIKPDASKLKTRTRINLEIIRQFKQHNIEWVKATPVHTKVDEVDLI